MYRQFAAIAVISEATRNALQTHLGDKVQQICVVPNGIDAARFRLPFPGEPKTTARVILSVGSLTPVKDQVTIIRAIAQIDGVKLMLAGDGPLRADLEATACHLGAGSRVEFLGIRRDIPRLIAGSDLYVQASQVEGFCLAVVEAMCGGLPCIVSRTTGLQETVGRAGLYFDPGNAEELASAIRALLADPSRRAELSLRGVDQANRFTLQACSARYQDFYSKVIQGISLASGC
jgi:glycosyltransferase involved in cell wall biosynthesis